MGRISQTLVVRLFLETCLFSLISHSLGKVHEALMRQRQIGVIPGIMGRLGDLGAIDKKYDVAISTVFGGALDILITDTTDTATQCIMYLKQV